MQTNMKYLFSFILISIMITSCGQATEGAQEIPEDLAGLKKMLTEQKQQAKKLDERIEVIQKKINKLQPEIEKEKILVESEILETKSIDVLAKVQGTVLSDKYAMASSETGGRLISLTVDEGDFVNQGQVIGTVDLESFEKQKAELETGLSLARDVFQRQSRLWEQNIGSEIQYLEAKNNVERIEKSLATMQSQISKKSILSPISGVIDQKFLSQGELAGPGTPIVKILNTSALKVVADIPEKYIGTVRRGQKVQVSYPALDQSSNKTISMVGRTIDPSNRTFKIEVKTGSQGGLIKPFLLAEVHFVSESLKDIIAISPELIQEEVSGKKYVFLNKDGKATKTIIETGESNDEEVVIVSGLEAGDEVVTEGAFFLKEGELIKTEQ